MAEIEIFSIKWCMAQALDIISIQAAAAGRAKHPRERVPEEGLRVGVQIWDLLW